ncbi:YncE family protein, partial [Micromonospora sp. NPDC005299]|uniref:YncE family protein n=1 Tax=Micromonospora sp. NPDC005299 TaxID=3364231 RepID=UPI0036A795BC
IPHTPGLRRRPAKITPTRRPTVDKPDLSRSVAMPEGQGKVSMIDTATNVVLTTIRGNPFPSTMTITPNGAFAYVLDNDGSPEVIDTATHEVTFPFPLDGTIRNGRIAFTPDSLRAYIVSEGNDFVMVLEVATHKAIAVVDVFGGRSTDVAVTGDGRQVWVTQWGDRSSMQRPFVGD